MTIRMNQADLAQLAGTSRESVSRFLADLERAGMVQPGRGRVAVLGAREAAATTFSEGCWLPSAASASGRRGRS